MILPNIKINYGCVIVQLSFDVIIIILLSLIIFSGGLENIGGYILSTSLLIQHIPCTVTSDTHVYRI